MSFNLYLNFHFYNKHFKFCFIKNSFILESVTGGEIRGRYSIIGMRPDKIWKCLGNENYIKKYSNNFNGTVFGIAKTSQNKGKFCIR